MYPLWLRTMVQAREARPEIPELAKGTERDIKGSALG
jgi:hypothetical protein